MNYPLNIEISSDAVLGNRDSCGHSQFLSYFTTTGNTKQSINIKKLHKEPLIQRVIALCKVKSHLTQLLPVGLRKFDKSANKQQ